jgi:hypothetical protein
MPGISSLFALWLGWSIDDGIPRAADDVDGQRFELAHFLWQSSIQNGVPFILLSRH